MKFTCFNELQLDLFFKNAYEEFKKKGALNLELEDYHKPTTLRQLGFFFGAICNAVKDHYHKMGDDSWTTEAVKDLFYQVLSPKIKMTKLNGDVYEHPLHLSEMNREQMAKFIDDSLLMIERADCFKGLILHPSVRFCWVHNITEEDMRNVDRRVFPRKCKEYLEYVRGQCCLCCGKFGCEAHHIRESENSGTGLKANDWETISLCPDCHRMYHMKGQDWFREQMKWVLKYMDLEDFCAICFNRWKNHF